jgi:hypothetical protein
MLTNSDPQVLPQAWGTLYHAVLLMMSFSANFFAMDALTMCQAFKRLGFLSLALTSSLEK